MLLLDQSSFAIATLLGCNILSSAYNLLHRRWLRFLVIAIGTLLLALIALYLLIPTLLKPALNLLLKPYAVQITQLNAERPSSTAWSIKNLELEGATFVGTLAELKLNYDLTSLRQQRLTTVTAERVTVTLADEPQADNTNGADSWLPQTLNPADWLEQLPWHQLQIQNLELRAPQAQLHLQGTAEQGTSHLKAALVVLEPQTSKVDRLHFEYDENTGVRLQLLNNNQATPVALLEGDLLPAEVQWNAHLNLEPTMARTLALLLDRPDVQFAGEVTANGSLAWPPSATLPWQELELTGSYALSASWLTDGQDIETLPESAEPPLQLSAFVGTWALANNLLTLAIERADLRYSAAGSLAQCSLAAPLQAKVLEPAMLRQIEVGNGLKCHLAGDRGQLDLTLDNLSYRTADSSAELDLALDFSGQFGQQKPAGKVNLSLQQAADALISGEAQLQLVSRLLLPPVGTAAKSVDLPWTLRYQPEQDLLTVQFAHQLKLGERVLSGFNSTPQDGLDASHALLTYQGQLQFNPSTTDGLKLDLTGDFAQLSLVHPVGTPAATLRLRPLQGSVTVALREDKLHVTGNSRLAGMQIPFVVRYNLASDQVAFNSDIAAELPDNVLGKTFANWSQPLDLGRGRVVSQLQGGWQGDGPMQLSAKFEHTGTSAHYEEYLAKDAAGVWQIQLQGDSWHAQTHRLTVGTLDVGLPIVDVSSTVRIEVKDDSPIIQLDATQLGLLGGRILVPSAGYDSARLPSRFNVSVQDISVAELLALEGTDITGTGQLSGTLPVVISAQGVQVNSGSLAAQPPGGTIRVADSFTQGMGQPGLDFALRALNNFTYDALKANVTYQESGDLNLGVTIEGRNPLVEAGRKIIYNLNINENVPALLESLQADKQITKQVEQRVNKGKK